MIPRTHFLIMLAAIAVNAALGTYFYPRLPDPCPIHWNWRGQVDDYGSPTMMAFGWPAITLGLAILLTGLPLLGPFRKNFDKFRITFGRICVTITVFLCGLQLVFLLAASGRQLRIGSSLCILIGLLFAVLGNWMGKLRRNLYVGIRTPWTIANEVVWERTHRLGGKLMVAAGLISAVTGLFAGDSVCLVVLLSSLIGTVGVAVIYSLVEYRRLGEVDDLSREVS